MREFINSLNPIIKNVKDAIALSKISGRKVEIDPPVNAPNKLAKTRADEEPRKTASGLLEVPLIVNVASCVLSPNSAIKTVRKVDNNKLNIIYKKSFIMSYAKKILISDIKLPVKSANLFGDIFFDNHFPISTPTILELIKAKALPRKTIIGFPDSADNIRVAICVLSPNSAIKIVVKVEKNIEKKLFSTFKSSVSRLLFILLILLI